MHTRWSWWLKQPDSFTVWDYEVIFTALCAEYKAKQNCCRELGVLPSFRARTFLKYKNIPELMIWKVRKDSVVFKQLYFIAKRFTVVDYHTLEAMFLFTTIEKNKETVTVLWTRDFLPRPFCLEIKVNLWRKKGKQLFPKTVVARNSVLQINNTHLNRSHCWQHLQEVTKKLSHSWWVDRSK